MRAHQNRRVPIEALCFFTKFRLGLNIHLFSCGTIVAGQIPLLPLAVNDIGVARFCSWLVTVTTKHNKPVAVSDTVFIVCARRSALCIVVLRSAINIVKWFGIIHCNFVKLRYWKIGDKFPCFGVVKGFIQTAIATYE